jgi:hypothetical protein
VSDDLIDGEQLELSEVLNTAMDRGVVVHGGVLLSIADIDLIRLDLALLLGAVETLTGRASAADVPSLASALGPVDLSPMAPRRREEAIGSTASTPESETFAEQGGVGESKASIDSPGPPARRKERSEVDLSAVARGLPERINADPENVENGLARLVLTLIEVLRKVLEHQAIRRMDGGTLSEAEVERLGLALLRLSERVRELKGVFGLTDEDLQIDLGPLGRLR